MTTKYLIKTYQGEGGRIQKVQIKGRSDVFAILNTVFKEQQYTEVEKQKIMLSTIFKISQSELTYKEATEAIYYMLLKKGLVPAEQNDIRLRENDLKFVEAMILYCRDKNYVFNKGNRMYVTNLGIKHMKKLIDMIKRANKKNTPQEVESPSYEVVAQVNGVDIMDVHGQLAFNLDQALPLPKATPVIPKQAAPVTDTANPSSFLGGQVTTEQSSDKRIIIDTELLEQSNEALYDFYGNQKKHVSVQGESLAAAIQTEAIKDLQVRSAMTEQEFLLGFHTFAEEFASALNQQNVDKLSEGTCGDVFKDTLAYALEYDYVIKQDLFGLGLYTYSLTSEGRALLDLD